MLEVVKCSGAESTESISTGGNEVFSVLRKVLLFLVLLAINFNHTFVLSGNEEHGQKIWFKEESCLCSAPLLLTKTAAIFEEAG